LGLGDSNKNSMGSGEFFKDINFVIRVYNILVEERRPPGLDLGLTGLELECCALPVMFYKSNDQVQNFAG
jgi:hypothetical protein